MTTTLHTPEKLPFITDPTTPEQASCLFAYLSRPEKTLIIAAYNDFSESEYRRLNTHKTGHYPLDLYTWMLRNHQLVLNLVQVTLIISFDNGFDTELFYSTHFMKAWVKENYSLKLLNKTDDRTWFIDWTTAHQEELQQA